MNTPLAHPNALPSSSSVPLADVILRIQPLPTRVVGAAEQEVAVATDEDALAQVALAAHRRRVFDSSYLPASEDRFRIH